MATEGETKIRMSRAELARLRAMSQEMHAAENVLTKALGADYVKDITVGEMLTWMVPQRVGAVSVGMSQVICMVRFAHSTPDTFEAWMRANVASKA